jgi:hypothetical protein
VDWKADVMHRASIKQDTAPRRPNELRAEWARAGVEPPLASLMDDPIVRQLMQSDGVTSDEFGRVVDEARRALRNRARVGGVPEDKKPKVAGSPSCLIAVQRAPDRGGPLRRFK